MLNHTVVTKRDEPQGKTLAWEHLGNTPSELGNVAREREVWGHLIQLLPLRPWISDFEDGVHTV